MYHILFEKNNQYKIAFLIKTNALAKPSLSKYYAEPLFNKGVASNDLIAFSLDSSAKTAKPQRVYLESLLPALDNLKVQYLLVNDVPYFKVLTGVKDASCTYGSMYNCVIKGYEHIKVFLGVNYQVFMHDPKQEDKLKLSLDSLYNAYSGIQINTKPNFKELKFFTRQSSLNDIKDAFRVLLTKPELAVDIEDISLNVCKSVIGTISFSWSDDTAYVFAVASDYAVNGSSINIDDQYYQKVLHLLKIFFSNYKGNLVAHRANYDFKCLIFNVFMNKQHFDYQSMLEGIEHFTRSFDDTKLIAYLATNSTARNELGLKILALPFAGNYGRDDITDITKIPLDELMEYNAIDTISTIWVKNKYYPIMVKDDQLDIYQNIFKPSMLDIIQMELVGVPLNYEKVKEVAQILSIEISTIGAQLIGNKYVQELIKWLRYDEFTKKNAQWKTKKEPLEYFNYIQYNPASNNQNQELLYEIMDLPIVDRTDKGNPSTGGDTLKKLKNHTDDVAKLEVLNLLIDLAEVSIIHDNFIQKFLNDSIPKSDGLYYLHGNFNLGGTVSGRLSSSDPNLQNIPSTGNKYAKLIKECVVAPPNWLLTGADFASLEDRISALTTKDPNKLKVYIDKFDGHCLRAYAYFGDKMPDIEVDSAFSINSIADNPLYKQLRQDSKAPTFLLTYGGTWHGLVNNCGFSEAKAKDIEAKYHELYVVSDQWVAGKIEQAAKDGYVTVAFGLKVRTPLLAKTVLNLKVTPYEAQAEARTAGNALGQSYGLLNNRAAIEYRTRLMASPYKLDVMPIMQIHDAQYHLIKKNIKLLEWHNNNLIECMEWQELPEIQHDQVGLGGELSVFYPNWKEETKLPNKATIEQIKQCFK